MLFSIKFYRMELQSMLARAKDSGFYRFILNFALNRMIPFNQPHGFKIVEVGDNRIKVRLPYKRRNFNHIRGLHACALATVTEYTSGLMLISRLDARKFRLIMQRLEMDYHYQGKADAFAEFSVDEAWLNEHVYLPLQEKESVVVICEVKIVDSGNNHLTTGKVFWQIKDWQKVKTKIGQR